MSSLAYELSMPVYMLHDQEDDRVWLDSRLESDDYFISLATQLDMISKELSEGSYALLLLNKIIRNLEYLQENYTITKKD